ncbi:SpoIIE family protein phosphatase [Blastococcus sp. TF02A-26]|uniref:SpoIIE family protein phosphatase n=1 Tax=Blastococcus sp. TF02A-26 TaxID=2250577 RepID=UPI000DEABA2A|nr:SpoIIE family protein phosphatase [Blastococcus sp. TF02A-26]RBY83356.1 histidine kinase [Blastococcus sp. TF02A-26]
MAQGVPASGSNRTWTGSGRTDALNRLADLAAGLLGAGSAQVSLLTDVQTVAGGAGVARDAVGSRGPLEDSLCTVTADLGGPLVVAEASSDDRVSGLPPVTSGVVGSYLGVPLTDPAGRPLGALCVFDVAPRDWSAADVRVLEQLAHAVVSELKLSAVAADSHAHRTRWDLAADAAGVGTFELDLGTGVLTVDDRLLELSGMDRASFTGRPEDVYAHVHPEDVRDVVARVRTALDTAGDYDAEYRIVLADGTHRWVNARGRVLDDGGGPRLVGVASDSTAQREPMQRAAQFLEGLAVAFIALDRDWVMTHVNASAERIGGRERSEVLGRTVWEAFPATVGSEFETRFRRAVATGEPVAFDAYYPHPLDVWVEVRAVPRADGLSLYFLDVTERIRQQQRLELLASVTARLTGTLDAEEAVARLAQLVVPALADWCLVTLVGEDWQSGPRRGLRDVGWHHADPELQPVVAEYARERIPALTEASFVARALGTGRPVVLGADATDRILEVLAPGLSHELLRRLAPESFAVLPLRGRDRTVGLLSLFTGSERGSLTAEQLATAEDIAGRAGLALDNARLYRQQRQLAEGLQRSLLTAPEHNAHLEIEVRYTPATAAAQVGGDWYDAFPQPGGSTIVTIGDVLGHNTEAAAAMGQLRAMLRAIAVTTGGGPAEVLQRVDEAMASLRMGPTTATAVVVQLEPDEEEPGAIRVRWSNAGHPPPMLVGADGGVSALTGRRSDLLLGVDDTAPRRQYETTLAPGGLLVLYTDGLVERRDRDLDHGLDRLRAALADRADLDLEDLCDDLLDRLLDGSSDDDVALVAVRPRRTTPPEGTP